MHQKHPFHTRKGDDGFNRGSASLRKGDDGFSRGSAGARKGDGSFNPTQIPASKGDTGFRQAGTLADRARLQCRWAAAGPGRATSGRPTLQTSSNQRELNRLSMTSVTNVVNLSPKTSIFSEKALGLTTFVTAGQKSTRKTPWIDDVCNNTRQATHQHTRHHRCGERQKDLSRCRWAAAGPGLRKVACNSIG